MYCSNCGSDIQSARYCGECGTAAQAPTSPGSGALIPAPPPPAPATTASFTHQTFSDLVPEQAWHPPRVSFGEAISAGFRGYVVWNARSTRAEYWWWTLFNLLVVVGALLVDSVLTGGLLYLIAVVALFLPNLSVFIRRLHDIDKSGGWFWFGLIPLVGPIVLLVFVFTPSELRATRWNRSLVLDT